VEDEPESDSDSDGPENLDDPSATSRKRPLDQELDDAVLPPREKRKRVFLYDYAPSPTGTKIVPIMLVNSARKRTTVVDAKEGAMLPEFNAAMDEEITAFRTMKCIENVLVRDLANTANIVTTRWVPTIKTKEDGSRRYKARLIARGFEDDERLKVTRDSPTASSSSHRLVLQALVEHQWTPTSWDFETAFLQGNAIQRDIFLVPPSGYAAQGQCWRLCKPIYGLVSAPRRATIACVKLYKNTALPQTYRMKRFSGCAMPTA
jgi:Reverse transcriptase (RNA-dependent DNA polymerase)